MAKEGLWGIFAVRVAMRAAKIRYVRINVRKRRNVRCGEITYVKETGGKNAYDYEFFEESAGGHDGCSVVYRVFAEYVCSGCVTDRWNYHGDVFQCRK